MQRDFSTIGFIKSIPALMRNVWPGMWILVPAVSAGLFFSGPSHLTVLSLSDFIVLHILAVLGMLGVTTWLYNTYERPAVNMAVAGIWFLASAACMLVELLLNIGNLVTGQ